MPTKYFSVERLSEEEESVLEEKGTPARNYGRLDRAKLEELVNLDMHFKNKKQRKIRTMRRSAPSSPHNDDTTPHDEIDMKRLFDRPRPWRLTRFLKEISDRPGCKIGEVTHADYTIRVVEAGLNEALGKSALGEEDEDEEHVEMQNIPAEFRQSINLLLKPYDAVDSSNDWWEGFELWREILGTTFVNLIPDRPFSLYIYAKDAVGDDVPVYYFELEIGNIVDRHVIVWELDQVLTSVEKDARPHEASLASEYASAYQKLYFFLNWDEPEERRVCKVTIADLPRRQLSEWNKYFDVLTNTRPSDALISIVVIITTTYFSIIAKNYSISLVAGILVAGIAAEEFIPPSAIMMGAIARFYSNESLALHMYYAANLDLSTKRVIITLLASMGEIVDFVNDQPTVTTFKFLGLETTTGDVILIFASAVSCFGLMNAAFAGVYSQFSHSDFPRTAQYSPKVYTDRKGFVTQVVEDCKPVEEFSSVYRPILHWQRGMEHRFLGNEIDWGSPGSPSSWICYFMSTPASSVIATKSIYGYVFRFWLVPFACIEQLLALIGGLLIIMLDFPVVFMLFISAIASKFVSRSVVKQLNKFALALYFPADVYRALVDEYNVIIADMLDLQISYARKRSTARLYRFPLCKSVRTGRSSNHSWKFGDYMYDSAYYRVSDMVLVNPRASKLGMMDSMRLFYKRHKLIWNTNQGIRFSQPVLSCGDNTVSRKDSYFGKPLNYEEERKLAPGTKPQIYIDPSTGVWSNYRSDRDVGISD